MEGRKGRRGITEKSKESEGRRDTRKKRERGRQKGKGDRRHGE